MTETIFIGTNKIFTITDDGTGYIWNLLADKEEEWIAAGAKPTVACTSQDGRWLAVGDKEGAIQLLDQTTDEVTHIHVEEYVNAMSFLCGKNDLAVGTPTGYSIFSRNGDLIKSNAQRDAFSLSYSPDGRYFAWASEDGFLQLLYQGLKIGNIQTGEGPEFVFDSATQFIYIATFVGAITKVAVDNLKTVLSFSTVESTYITALAISPDGKLLATSTDDGVIHLWRTGDGKLLEVNNAHDKAINTLDFHPNSQYLLSGSDDGTAIVWAIE